MKPKRILAMLLSFAMLFAILPGNIVFAAKSATNSTYGITVDTNVDEADSIYCGDCGGGVAHDISKIELSPSGSPSDGKITMNIKVTIKTELMYLPDSHKNMGYPDSVTFPYTMDISCDSEYTSDVTITNSDGYKIYNCMIKKTKKNHSWSNGTCTTCKKNCSHTWSNGKCTTCELVCSHNWSNGICETCKYQCDHSQMENNVCQICGNSGMRYLNPVWNSNENKMEYDTVLSGTFATTLTAGDKTISSGWYIVENDVTINNLTISGTVNLILADGAKLTCSKITLTNGNKLNIYAQSTSPTTAGYLAVSSSAAFGIGNNQKTGAGTLTINGGVVTVNCSSSTMNNLVGIGGGSSTGKGGTVIVNGGTVTANGKTYGIGGCYSSGGSFNMNGGIVFVSSTNASKNYKYGIVFEGNNGTICGTSYTLEQDFTVPSGKTLTVEEGKTLIVAEGTTLTIEGSVVRKGTIINHGTIICKSGHTYIADCSKLCDICLEKRTPLSDHKYDSDCDDTCNLCGEHRDISVAHDYENGICKNCGAYQPAVWNSSKNYYEISNAVQLMWFASLVNGTLTDGTTKNQSANAVLMNDIDMSGVTGYTPIGTTGLYYSADGTDKGYSGTFDGNGCVIKNLTFNGSDSEDLTYGIFGTLSGKVSRLGVENMNFTKGNADCRAGGIVGQMITGSSVTNCYAVNSTISADGKVAGGLAGCNYAGTIENCYTYKVTVTATRAGGIVGDNRGDGGDNDRKGTITNCYTNASDIQNSQRQGNVNNSTAGMSDTAFTGGELAYLLNGSKDNGIWEQTIGTDSYPNFSGGAVYKTAPCVGYSNGGSVKNHSYDDLNCCTVCGKLKLNADGYYEIDNAEKLFYFAQRINKGEYNINARLMADLDLTGKTWTPIAYLAMSDSATVGYTGIFDGNGHVISNITIVTPTAATANGFFGIITTGTVKTLGIDNLYFDNNDKDHRAGGIAGQLMTGGTIENCFVVNSTIKASSRVVGGIVGMCKGTVKNCYTANLTLAGYTNRFGGITGDYKDGSIVNCYTDHTALGSTADSVGTKDALSQTSVSIDDFASGKITWLLNDNSSEGVWKQTIGTDNYPSFKGATVYKTTPCVSYTNTEAEKQHDFDENGIICKNCAGYQQAEKNDEDCYEISNLSQLLWFADKVNNGEVSINGKLMNDIDATSVSYIGIGKDASHAFAGTFDGNNKTLKIALVSTEQYVAPFPYVNGATIKNLTVSGTLKTTHKFAASIVGRVESGNADLENCLSLVEIDSTNYTGDGTHGGLIAVVGGGTTTVNNCGFAGSIIGENTTTSGGIVGWAGSTVKISNSFVAATFTLQNNSGDTFARNQSKVTVTNCYYMNALSDAMYSGAIQATADRFASGEVAYHLQGTQETQIWGQKIGTDKYPTFSTAKVYEDTYNGVNAYRNEIDGNKILLLGADKKSATVVFDKSGTYTIVFADYEGENLANIKTFEVTVDKAQAVRVVSDKAFTLGTGDKIMLWDNLENLTPMCEAYEVK